MPAYKLVDNETFVKKAVNTKYLLLQYKIDILNFINA